jgi:hypothetical protein
MVVGVMGDDDNDSVRERVFSMGEVRGTSSRPS